MSTEPQPENQKQNQEQNQLASIVMQLEDLVKLALAAEKNEVQVSIDSFVDVHKKLMGIYHMIETFRTSYAQSLTALGLKPEDLQPSSEEIEQLGVRERKIYEKLGVLKSLCEEAKERVHSSLQQQAPGAMNEVKEELKGPERKLVRRKGKFKGVGGKKGWLPS